MGKNDELILSLKAVLYGCAKYHDNTGGGLFFTSGCNLKKKSIVYDDAMANVIDLIEKLKSEVN